MHLFEEVAHEKYREDRNSIWEALNGIPVVGELEDVHYSDYVIVPTSAGLEDLVGNSDIIIVNGAYWGDEGKGRWTDLIASSLPRVAAVVRLNSADNAAHSLKVNGMDITCHIVPSGILTDKPCYIAAETVFDPVRFMTDEIQELRDHNIDYSKLFVGNFHVTTPYHRIMDLLGSTHNSSTLSGVGPSHASKARRNSIRLNDLRAPRTQQEELFNKDLMCYREFLAARDLTEEGVLLELKKIHESGKREIPQYFFDFVSADNKGSYLIDLYEQYVTKNEKFPKQVNVEHEIRKLLAEEKALVFESPQSNPLSNSTSQYFHTNTSAHTHASGVAAASRTNVTGGYKVMTLNIQKFPVSSKVGIGPAPAAIVPQDRLSGSGINNFSDLENACLDYDSIQKKYFENIRNNGIIKPTEYEDETGKYLICEAMAISSARHFGEVGGTSKKPRIPSLFDCVLERMVADEQGPNLIISAMDRGDDCDYVGLTVAYIMHIPENSGELSDDLGEFVECDGTKYRSGRIIRPGQELPDSRVLKYCHSITKVLPGWKDTPIAGKLGNFKEGDSLPPNVCRTMAEIEHYTGFEIKAIGVGKEREALYFIEKAA